MNARLLLFSLVAAALLMCGCASSSTPAQKESLAPPPSWAPAPDTVYTSHTSLDVLPKCLNTREMIDRMEYPKEARDTQGMVVVQVVVTKDGRPAAPKIIESPHPALARVALDAVRYLRFEPARKGGAPVATKINVPFSFRRPDLD